MLSLFWLFAFTGASLYLAYRRTTLAQATLVLGALVGAYTLWGAAGWPWKTVVWLLFAPMALLNIAPLRLAFVTRPFLLAYRRMLPSMSSDRARGARGRHGLVGRRAVHRRPELGKADVGEAARAHGRGAGLPRRPVRGPVPDGR